MNNCATLEPAVEIENLFISGQGGFHLDVPSFALTGPGVTVVIGRNGAGKSTFLDAVLNLIEPTSGQVRLFGRDLAEVPVNSPVRHNIGAQVQGISWSWSIKVGEILALHTTLYSTTSKEVLDSLGVQPLHGLLYRKLSTGQKRRVDLGFALAHAPSLLVLDEPSSGLDRQFDTAYRQQLARLVSGGATVLMASHDPRDLAIADRVVWLENGRIINDDHPQSLITRLIGDYVCMLEDAPPEIVSKVVFVVAPHALLYRSRENCLLFTGGDNMRAAFLDVVGPHSGVGYSVRPARAPDLIELVAHAPAGRSPC